MTVNRVDAHTWTVADGTRAPKVVRTSGDSLTCTCHRRDCGHRAAVRADLAAKGETLFPKMPDSWFADPWEDDR